MLSINRRQAYTEIDNYIALLDEEYRNKIPKKLRDFFKKEKDNNYTKFIDPNVPIKDQNLKKETLALIAMLNLQYWCEDEDEKKRLKKVYSDNEIKHQQKLREIYNPDTLFEKKQKSIESNQQSLTAFAEYKKDSLIKKIKRFILNFFRR